MIALDPVLVTDNESVEVGELIYEGLVGWKPGTTDIEPRLATRWEVSADGRTWTFHLRDHVAFHDGTPFDADAVVFSFERLLDPKHPSYLGADVAGYWRTLLKDVDKVIAMDPLTVEIYRQAAVRAAARRSREVSDRVADRGASAGATRSRTTRSAPGRSSSRRGSRASRSSCDRFDGYWGAAPALERIVFQVVVDARQRLIELESGSVDLATAILPDEQPFVELHPDLAALRHAAQRRQLPRVQHAAPAVRRRARAPRRELRDQQGADRQARVPGPRDRRRRAAAADAVGLSRAGDRATPTIRWRRASCSPRPSRPTARSIRTGSTSCTRRRRRGRTCRRPSASRGSCRRRSSRSGSRPSSCSQPYLEHRAAVERGEHDLCCSAGSATPAIPTTSSTCCSRRDNASRRDAQNVAFYRDPEVDQLLVAAQATSDERDPHARSTPTVQDQIAADAPWVPIAHSRARRRRARRARARRCCRRPAIRSSR